MTETKTGWWEVDLKLILEGEEVSFDDLSDVTQEHIIRCISEGYRQGEIVEDYETVEEEDDTDEDSEQTLCDMCAENK